MTNLWRPYTQMRTAPPPLRATHTQNCTITLANGRQLTDGIASWWTACHGYNHPHIAQAVTTQLARMPHIMFGGLTHDPAEHLATRLATLLPGDLNHVFLAESGSVAVEIAMKMAAQYWLNQSVRTRTRFLHFTGAYHGDTFATMAVCDPHSGMHRLYTGLLAQHPILDLPQTPDAAATLDSWLEEHAHTLAGIIVEPLVQGAGGMLTHPPHILQHLRRAADAHHLPLIFDEIFTGFGRTGTLFACQAAGVIPDIITLSKALTGGTMPLSATVARTHIFEAFLSTDPQAALMHGPTYMANPLACAAALASLDLFEAEPRLAQVAAIAAQLTTELTPLATHPAVADVRILGAIAAVELHHPPDMATLKARLLAHDVWIRPLQHVLYLTPAFTIPPAQLTQLTNAITQTVQSLEPA